MSDNALDAAKQIQEGLSMVKLTSTIENVLLVEGFTDAKFYKYFTNKIIHHGLPSEKNSIREIVSSKLKENKNIYGIIDKDYAPQPINKKLQNYLFMIDAHSLETMLIKHIEPENFENLIKKKVLYKYTSGITNNLTRDSLEWSFRIGCLRKASIIHKINLPFNKLIQEKDFFKDYIYEEKGNKRFGFNFDEFLKDLINDSKYSENDIKKYIEPFDEKKCWCICRGHDVFDFIDAISRIRSNNKRIIQKSGKPKGSTIPSWEHKLLEKQKFIKLIKKKFQKSELLAWLDRIDKF